MKKKRATRNALEILGRLTGDDAELRDRIAQETLNCRIARMIYDARTHAGLTQRGLAEAVGTTQSVIARLEDADYEGHSLSMLRRIGDALHRSVEIGFSPPPGRRSKSRRLTRNERRAH